MDTIRRGDIYFIHRGAISEVGAETFSGRPGVIVSATTLNASTTVYQIVYLTTQPKEERFTHVSLEAKNVMGLMKDSTICCEQLVNVYNERLGNYIGRVPDAIMEDVDRAIMRWLDLERYVTDGSTATADDDLGQMIERDGKIFALEKELEEVKMRAEIYKELYEGMVNKMLSKS